MYIYFEEVGYWKSIPIFVGNVLVQVRHVFLSDYPLVLSLFKLKGVGVFWNKKKKIPVQIGKAP